MIKIIDFDAKAGEEFKHKIELKTLSDIMEFVRIVSSKPYSVKLTDEENFCVSGKSVLGVFAAIEWKSLYCLSGEEIYPEIKKFCID